MFFGPPNLVSSDRLFHGHPWTVLTLTSLTKRCGWPLCWYSRQYILTVKNGTHTHNFAKGDFGRVSEGKLITDSQFHKPKTFQKLSTFRRMLPQSQNPKSDKQVVLVCAVAWGLNTFAWVVSTGVSALVPRDVSWKTRRKLPRLDLCLLVGNCPPLRHWNQPLRQWLCSGAWMTSKGQTCLRVHSLSVHSWKSFVLELRFAPLQCSSVCSVLVVRRDEIIDWIFRCIFVFQPASNWQWGMVSCGANGGWRCRDSKTGGFGPNVGHDADITATHYAWLPSGCGRVGLGLQLGFLPCTCTQCTRTFEYRII